MTTSARNDFYVYVLTYADGTPFYVGKGRGKRIDEHAKRAKRGDTQGNQTKHELILALLGSIGEVPYRKVASGMSEDDAFVEERRLISEIGREPMGTLVNQTAGGEGTANLSPESHARMVAAQTAAAQSPNGRLARSLRAIAQHSCPEFKIRHSAAITAAHARADVKERHSAALKATNGTDEARKQISVRSTQMHATPGFKEKHIAIMTAIKSTPEQRAAASARFIAMHADPAIKERHRLAVIASKSKSSRSAENG